MQAGPPFTVPAPAWQSRNVPARRILTVPTLTPAMPTPRPCQPDARTTLFAFLDGLGIAHATVQHPPLFTVEQSRRPCAAQIPGGHTKNLFLKDKKGALFLVVALEDAAIDAEVAASPARRHRPLLVRLGRAVARDARASSPAR